MARDGLLFLGFLFALFNQKKQIVISPGPGPSAGPVVSPPVNAPPVVMPPVVAPSPSPSNVVQVVPPSTSTNLGTLLSAGQTAGPVKGSSGGGAITEDAGKTLGSIASSFASSGAPKSTSGSVSAPASGHGNASPSSDAASSASGALPSGDDSDEAEGSNATDDAGGSLGNIASSFVHGPEVIQPFTGPLPKDVKPLGRASAAEVKWGATTAQYLQPWQWAANHAIRVIVRREVRSDGAQTAVLYR